MFCVSVIKLLLDHYFVKNYDFGEVVCMLMFMDTLNTPIDLYAHVMCDLCMLPRSAGHR